MRYNHHLHRHNLVHRPKTHHRERLTSFIIIATAIAFLLILNQARSINWVEFYQGFCISLYRVVIAYLISAALALILGLVATKNRTVEAVLLPILDVAQSFPTFAILPFLLHIFGNNSAAVIGILVITIIWPITFTVIGGIKTMREDLSNAAYVYHARGAKRLIHFTLPALLPAFMTGSIVGWGEAWEALVGAEIIAQVSGVGSILGTIGSSNQAGLLLLGICMYLLLIFLINQAVWLPLLSLSARYQND